MNENEEPYCKKYAHASLNVLWIVYLAWYIYFNHQISKSKNLMILDSIVHFVIFILITLFILWGDFF